jgi:hypothetical protein
LFFSARQDKSAILAQLHLQRGLHQRLIDQFRTETVDDIAKTAEKVPALRKDAILWDATRRFGEMTEETYIHWLDETIAKIENEF